MTPYPDILTAHVAITTNAVANTQQSDALLAAPGAGTRYRLWGVSMAPKPNNTGAIRSLIRETGSTTIRAVSGINAALGQFEWFGPNGIECGTNQAIENRNDSNVASQPFNCMIYYSIETL